ncbi:hypothetical protein FACS189421_03770 [Bacteroidia bacterium]|nr:hypothetical protein FACS189421_03770 [Bacteroidia bacterium]GHT51154.1 hypothetical protein FACS189440_19780 [Bacteroidia bacterium]
MKNPAKAYETGEMLLNQFDMDMASLYFESAGDSYLEIGNREDAVKAYEQFLYCAKMLGKDELAKRAKEKLAHATN